MKHTYIQPAHYMLWYHPVQLLRQATVEQYLLIHRVRYTYRNIIQRAGGSAVDLCGDYHSPLLYFKTIIV